MVDYKMFTKEDNEDVQKVVDEISEYLLNEGITGKGVKEFIKVKLNELSDKHPYIVELDGVDTMIIKESLNQFKKKQDEK